MTTFYHVFPSLELFNVIFLDDPLNPDLVGMSFVVVVVVLITLRL